MSNILIIGTASLDTLHLNQQSVSAPGGAGLYTALAAHQADATVTLFAPKPDPMSEVLLPIAQRIDWLGPSIGPEELPLLEIAHHGDGKATLLNASWGAESRLLPGGLPADLSTYDFVHIAALSSAQRQLDFLAACRERGVPKISVGTYAKIVYGECDTVHQLFEEADIFFMNENEATGLFGTSTAFTTAPNRLLFVTQGEAGALIIQGKQSTHIPTPPASEIDPTGAGDTFCGTTLARLALGLDPLSAATQATQAASRMITQIGPSDLLKS